MNTKTVMGISLAAILAVTITPAFAGIDPLTILDAEARAKDHPNGKDLGMKVEINTVGDFPTEVGTLRGAGVFLDGGNTTAIVTTSHGGAPFVDSELQSDANDPVWHNHFVILNTDDDRCNSDISVVDLSFESFGTTKIDDNEAKLTEIPNNSNLAATSGLDAGTTPIGFNTGTLGDTAVTFSLTVENGAVCVNPIDTSPTTD